MLTISKLKQWSINYYIDTAQTAERAAKDRARAAGVWGSTTPSTGREPRFACWRATLEQSPGWPGLSDAQHAGGFGHAEVVARWLDDGVTPNGAHGRALGKRGVHGFDLTFCAPKSVSLVRALRTDDVTAKAIGDAHTAALAEAMEYLAVHAGYTRVHNRLTGEKDLVRLPGLTAAAYQHEPQGAGTRICTRTSSCRIARPAPTGEWCPSTGRRCITRPAPPASSIRRRCAASFTDPWDLSGHRSIRQREWPSWLASTATDHCRQRSWRPPRKPRGPTL